MSLPPQGSTTALKKHLQKVWQVTGKKPQQLADQPPLPEPVSFLWTYYLELQNKASITYAEIESWSRLTRKNITANEALILHALDSLYWNIINGRSLQSSHQSK